MAGRRPLHGPAAGTSRLHPGHGRLFPPREPCKRPSWRKAGRDEGFRIVGVRSGDVRRLSRHVGEVRVPKVGRVRFRWSRAVPAGVKSYRITLDRTGRWHIAFAAIPQPVPAPGNGKTVGVDRGVAVGAALSTGEMMLAPALSAGRRQRLRRLQRKFARARRGSSRRVRVKLAIARLRAREVDARKDWVEKASTAIVRSFDVIRVENLQIRSMTRSARGTAGIRAGCPCQGRAQPGDYAFGLGIAGPPPGGESPWKGRESQAALHEPTLLGVRARGPNRVRAKRASYARPAVSPATLT